MSKLKKLFPLLMVFSLICMGLSPVSASAETMDNNKSSLTNAEIQELADELEYIFTNILIKDENTGIYNVNVEALNNSHYTQEERQQFLEYAAQINSRGTFDRCMQDLLGISAAAWNEVKGLIDAGNYFSAAATLAFILGVYVNPVAIAIFVVTCGPSSAGR
ncbi:hypothetical protein ACQKMI_24255 [Lysinibacillus sp. NPDC097214]|uniref:hypothetical protein n=1 Tax=Lysinibacillus sp. NPDC097214 TaxID=3390584 RepID=UPI003D03D954